jgi:hypothetical protein
LALLVEGGADSERAREIRAVYRPARRSGWLPTWRTISGRRDVLRAGVRRCVPAYTGTGSGFTSASHQPVGIYLPLRKVDER